ncbi:MAG: urea transporter [Candidatus Micrarchaeota archaeon]|nr:urea transporter [Candidatus Micrarchaeota archaeon]
MDAGRFVRANLKGMSKIMLQENEITGLIFLIAVFVGSFNAGLGAVLGVVVGTLTAMLLGYKKEEIESGTYGFNGALVGIGILYFFEFGFVTFFFAVIGAAISTPIMEFMRKRNLAPFTFPFVLSGWVVILFLKATGLAQVNSLPAYESQTMNIISGISTGFAQVMLQDSVIVGLLFFIGLLVSSRTVAAYGLLGSALGLAAAYAFSLPLGLISAGIFGYNGVLCGIAFAERKVSSFAYAVVAILLSVAIVWMMGAYDLIALTFPFVLATWIVLGVRKFAGVK